MKHNHATQSTPIATVFAAFGIFRSGPAGKPALVDGVLDSGLSLDIAGGDARHRHWLALVLAAKVAAGRGWLGRPCRPGRVLYVSTGRTPLEIRDELDAIAREKRMPVSVLRERIEVVASLHRSGRELIELVHRRVPLDDEPPALVVVDEAKSPASRYARRAHMGCLAALARSLGTAVAVVRSGRPDENADAFDAHCRIAPAKDGRPAVFIDGPVGGRLDPIPVRWFGGDARA